MGFQSSVNNALQTTSIASSIHEARKQVELGRQERLAKESKASQEKAIREKARDEARQRKENRESQRLDFQQRYYEARIGDIASKAKERAKTEKAKRKEIKARVTNIEKRTEKTQTQIDKLNKEKGGKE